MQANTIDEVIAILDGIIAEARRSGIGLGNFPVLYRQVTQAVKTGITNQRFEDGLRMEQLDVVFANRYFAAYQEQRVGGRPRRA